MKPLAGIYARVSLEEQAQNFSLPSQQRECRRLAAEKGYRVTEATVFVDDGLGGELDRVALTRLREAARAGLIQAVCCHDPDRLSRKLSHLLLLTEEFERSNVPLLFVHGAADSTPEGKMFLSMRGAFAEFEKLKLAERVSRGRRQKATEGHVNGGRTAYGFRYLGKQQGKRGELAVIASEAETVRRIFTWADEGMRLLEMARRLQADGVPTRSGRPWAKPVLSQMLRYRGYVGEAFYNRTASAETAADRRRKPPAPGRSKKTTKRTRPQAEWIAVRVPAIVGKALFQRVQKRLAADRHVNSGRPSPYILRGLIRCGACGFACVVYPNRGRARYRCGNYDRLTHGRLCTQPSALVADLEAAVWNATVAALENPARVAKLIEDNWRERTAQGKQNARERAALAREIARLQGREARAADGLLDAELRDAWTKFRTDLKATAAERRQLEARLAQLEPVAEVARCRAELAEYADQFGQFYARRHETDPEKRRTMLRQVVERVDLEDGEIAIHFRLDMTRNCISQESAKYSIHPAFTLKHRVA